MLNTYRQTTFRYQELKGLNQIKETSMLSLFKGTWKNKKGLGLINKNDSRKLKVQGGSNLM